MLNNASLRTWAAAQVFKTFAGGFSLKADSHEGAVCLRRLVAFALPWLLWSCAQASEIPLAKFTDVTREAGITFVHENGAYGDKLLPETMGGGVAFFDYDNDGVPGAHPGRQEAAYDGSLP